MQLTPDNQIKDQSWYWVQKENKIEYEPMQAQIYQNEITWWEVMKDWETSHDEVQNVGEEIIQPK